MATALLEKKENEITANEVDLFVPGRLCLFGEHSDWAGRFADINSEVVPGQAIVTGINLGIYATAKRADTFKISSFDEQGNSVFFECEMKLATLKEKALEDDYFCFACGVAAVLRENYKIEGIDIEISKVTLPIKKGLSSSAAICVLVAKAFSELYNLNLSRRGVMDIAYRGEIQTKSRCGKLDQACAYGEIPVCMEFNGDELNVSKLKVGKDLYWVFADLMAAKDTRKILSDLNKCYPFVQDEKSQRVHDALGKYNVEIVSKVKTAMETGDAQKIGELMTEAQDIFDTMVAPACPEELLSPKLHKVLSDESIKMLAYGGKGVGSQGDGTVQFIAKDKKSQAQLVEYLKKEHGLDAYAFTIYSLPKIKKAIIPVAGFGTRMYPETRFIKKAFLPVPDENNVIKPAIMYMLEELDSAGIDEIILIVGEDDIDDFKKAFSVSLSDEHISKLPAKVRGYEKLLSRVSGKIRYAVQKERNGFGDAVYQAREYIGNEPSLLLLGDFIYKSYISNSCVSQIMSAYMKSGGMSVVSIKPVDVEDVVHYGILSGDFDEKVDYLMRVTDMVEKPSVDYAKDYLGVNIGNQTNYYATFGQYVLTPVVFDMLKEEIDARKASGSKEEVSLTNVLHTLASKSCLKGALIKGKSYDVGIPSEYIATFKNFRK